MTYKISQVFDYQNTLYCNYQTRHVNFFIKKSFIKNPIQLSILNDKITKNIHSHLLLLDRSRYAHFSLMKIYNSKRHCNWQYFRDNFKK